MTKIVKNQVVNLVELLHNKNSRKVISTVYKNDFTYLYNKKEYNKKVISAVYKNDFTYLYKK